ncbi:hypothetical protein RHMOL_Rhmol05G0065500 [Rhododendron molle]|uniref:Uncharacterized protein n=1 Tax=Rhododendron molle TaxID=49168 RepID=A0ACC0NMD2_RHOML|nr:hypothetical protein RHMOL_Rhmol05G0065500 [Rhododendron molle]
MRVQPYNVKLPLLPHLQARLSAHLQAANYLNIKSLLDSASQTVADMIKGKSPEEIRKTFNIKNDFTPEEEEEVRRKKRRFAGRMLGHLSETPKEIGNMLS